MCKLVTVIAVTGKFSKILVRFMRKLVRNFSKNAMNVNQFMQMLHLSVLIKNKHVLRSYLL